MVRRVYKLNQIHLWPEKIIEDGDRVIAGFTLESPDGDRQKYWYRLPSQFRPTFAPYETGNCDAYLSAVVMYAMKRKADIIVHGDVSVTLLGNLDEFMTIWNCWLPDDYKSVDIRVEESRDLLLSGSGEAVLCFSGGVDSSYSAWRYRNGPTGRIQQRLTAGVMLHGFDIPLRHSETFERAFRKAELMLNSLGYQAIPLATNLKWLGDYEMMHGAMLASCLMMLRGRYDAGLIASSIDYKDLKSTGGVPYGSNILTDELLSSRAFRIYYDGSGLIRLDKIAIIAEWPEAMQHLRVCLREKGEAEFRDENCCRCNKCTRNMVAFRALALEQPPCFPHPIKNRNILRMRYSHPARFYYFNKVLEQAAKNNDFGPWVWALRLSLMLNRIADIIIKFPIVRNIRGRK